MAEPTNAEHVPVRHGPLWGSTEGAARGWVRMTCDCGWSGTVVPATLYAIEEYGDHREVVGRGQWTPPVCGSCNGAGRLYTSSWDDEGYSCPQCQRCTCGLSDGHPDYAHTTSCTLSGRRYTEQTAEHADWCSDEHEGKCLDHLIHKTKYADGGNGGTHAWTQNPHNPNEPDCDICGRMKDFHG